MTDSGTARRKQSPESNAKRSATLTGRRASPQACQNISKAKKGVLRPDIAGWAPAKFRQFDDRQVALIREDRRKGLTYRQLAEKHQCFVSTAYRVVNAVGPAYQG
jgi:hypothetical protein